MVDYKIRFKGLISRSNEKQNSYISNIFGVGGGAVMYTAWQVLLAEAFSFNLWIKLSSMLILSIILLFIGYSFIGESKNERNDL
jgi:membrane protein implicated in regulation of membrane protease activity